MKPAIAITTTTLVCILAAGLAWAQSPQIIQNVRNTMSGVSANTTAASNAALGIQSSAPTAASVTHAPAKSVAPISVTPMKSVAGARNPHGPKHGPRLAARHGAPSPVVTAPANNNPPVGAAVASNGTAGGENTEPEQQTTPDSKYAANGRRDPFISPVVNHAGGSGCSSGKKCLEIGTVNLRGVVHAESGFIAVVSNGLNKAYFLRENDPVFNGYVVKITGDSIVFQETLQDRLGKTFTREVVKKITTPAV
ncbi:MAG: hypothetical protein WBD25_12645 [Terriglobales bacterium]